MAYHEAFWVAAAAAAPVIALANQVTLSDSLATRRFFSIALSDNKLQGKVQSEARRGLRGLNAAFWLGYLNLGLQGVVLGLALFSLGDGHDYWLWQSAAGIVTLGLFAILATSMQLGSARDARVQLEMAGWKPAPTSGAHNDG